MINMIINLIVIIMIWEKKDTHRNPTSILIWAVRITEYEAAQTSASSVSTAPQKANKLIPLQACRGEHVACYLTLIICVLVLVFRAGGGGFNKWDFEFGF